MNPAPASEPSPRFGPQVYLGFAGKRNVENEPALRTAMAARLQQLSANLRNAEGGSAFEILAVASAAEGSDLAFLEVVKHANLPSRVVLPAAAPVFEDDFKSAETKQRFHRALADAVAVDLIRSPPSRRDGFTLCAEAVVRQSDTMFIAWDEAPGSQGGTSEAILLARQCEIPCVIFSTKDGRILVDELSGDRSDRVVAQARKRFESEILATLDEYARREPSTGRHRTEIRNETAAEAMIRRLGAHGTWLSRKYRMVMLVILLLHAAATFFGVVGLVFGPRIAEVFGHHAEATAELVFSALEFGLIATAVGFAIWSYRSQIHHRWVEARFIGEIRRSLLATRGCPGDGDFVPSAAWELYPGLRVPMTTFFQRYVPKPSQSLREFAEFYLDGPVDGNGVRNTEKARIRGQILYYERKSARAKTWLRWVNASYVVCTLLLLLCAGAALGFRLRDAAFPSSWFSSFFLRFAPVYLPVVSAALLTLPNLGDLNRRRNSYHFVAEKLRRLEKEMVAVLTDLERGATNDVGGVPIWKADAPALHLRFATNRVRTIVQETERVLLTEVLEFQSFCKNAEVG